MNNVINFPSTFPPCSACGTGTRYSHAHPFCTKCLNEGRGTAHVTGMTLEDAQKLDEATRRISACTSFADLTDNSGTSYCPTVRIDMHGDDGQLVADAFDAAMRKRGSFRRAYRYWKDENGELRTGYPADFHRPDPMARSVSTLPSANGEKWVREFSMAGPCITLGKLVGEHALPDVRSARRRREEATREEVQQRAHGSL
jgi:hypothetical protein